MFQKIGNRSKPGGSSIGRGIGGRKLGTPNPHEGVRRYREPNYFHAEHMRVMDAIQAQRVSA